MPDRFNLYQKIEQRAEIFQRENSVSPQFTWIDKLKTGRKELKKGLREWFVSLKNISKIVQERINRVNTREDYIEKQHCSARSLFL